MDPKQRLFLAVEVPASVRHDVIAAVRPWRETFSGARWVPPENWHVTLKFLGWAPERSLSWVGERVRGVVASQEPFTARVQGLGAFPSARRARVLWAGIADPSKGLASVAVRLERALAPEFTQETRPFHPHLTVARSDPPIRLPEAYADTALASETFVADGIVLFRSHLGGGRPTRYESLQRFPLSG